MSVYKQGSDTYICDFSFNGKRIRCSTKTSNKQQAKKFEADLIYRLEERLKTPKDIVFKELFLSFVKDKRILEIDKEVIFTFVHYLLGRNLAVASIKRYLAGISAVFSYGKKIGKTEFNPISNFDKSFLGKENKRIRFLTETEYQRLLECCSYDLLKKAVILAVETGFRKTELLTLKWEREQIDFKNKEITLWDTKNTEHRTIPVSPIALNVLEELYQIRDCEYVISINKKQVKNFQRSFNTALKKAQIEDFHWHDLRHTFATWALKGWFAWLNYPMDLNKLQKWLGHKDIKTTQRYAHLELQDLKKLVNYQT